MVLPGMRTDPRTPGGMPDSGTVNPGGPMPSMPKMGPGPGPTAPGVPDPGKLEELFTQYTTGQITREDLLTQLHTFSEGQGGILGLLESAQEQSDQGAPGMQPAQPAQPAQPVQPAAPTGALPGSPQGQGGAISPGAASVPIPPLEEPLDARHQQISQLLQLYGLGPADADQMASILNPHTEFHKTATGERTWSEDEQLWTTGDGSQIAYDEAQAQSAEIAGVGEGGTQSDLFRVQAGLGSTTGSTAGGYVGGKYYGEKSLFDAGSFDAQRAAMASRNMPGLQGREVAYDAAAVEAKMRQQQLDYQAQQEPEAWGGTMEEGLYSDPKTGRTYYNGREISRTQPKLVSTTDFAAKQAEMEQILPSGPTGESDADRIAREQQEALNRSRQAAKEEAERVEKERLAGLPFGGQTGDFHGFAGGTYDPEKYEALARSRGWNPTQIAENAPFEDPDNPGLWFPNKGSYDDYVEWQGEEGKLWGQPDITPEFSHWEKDGEVVEAGTPGATGVAKGAILVNVRYPIAGGFNEKSYHMNTYGMTENDIALLKRAMQDSYYIPWDENGKKLTGADAYQPGWQPEHGYQWLAVPGNKKPPKAWVPSPKNAFTPKDTAANGGLPDGWTWVEGDPDSPLDAGPGLFDDKGNFVGGLDENGEVVVETGQEPDEPHYGGSLYTGSTDDLASGKTPGTYADDPDAPWLRPGSQAGIVSRPGKAGQYPMFDKFVTALQGEGLTNDTLMSNIADVIGELEIMNEKGDQAEAQRTAEITVNELDRAAVTARAEADRKLQAGVALGEIEGDITLAASMEETKRVFEAASAAGVVPVWQGGTTLSTGVVTPGKWTVPTKGTGGEPLAKSLEGQALAVTEEDKIRQRELDFSTVFGKYINLNMLKGEPGVPPEAHMETLEAQKFGLTKALAEAEATGVFRAPDYQAGPPRGVVLKDLGAQRELIDTANSSADRKVLREFFILGTGPKYTPSGLRMNLSQNGVAIANQIQQALDMPADTEPAIEGTQTLSAKRLAWEIDMGNRAADVQDRLASNAEQITRNNLSLGESERATAQFIADGNLAEAQASRQEVTNARKEAAAFAKEKLKLDTLMALSDPSTYLFASRYGILEQIGSALDIDWGDDIIPNNQIGRMVAPGTFPSRQEFENATISDQKIMLAELASSHGFTLEQAAVMIRGGTPGGGRVNRPRLTGMTR